MEHVCNCTPPQGYSQPNYLRNPTCPLHGEFATERRASETLCAQLELQNEVRLRETHELAEALGADRATPWQDLVAIARATVIRRDQAIAQVEAHPFSAEQVIRLAYLLGCERVTMSDLGAKAIEVVEAALAEAQAGTGEPLLTAVARLASTQVRHDVRLCGSPNLEPSGGACSLLKDHTGSHWNSLKGHWKRICDEEHALSGARCTLRRGHEGHHENTFTNGRRWPNHTGPCSEKCAPRSEDAETIAARARDAKPRPIGRVDDGTVVVSVDDIREGMRASLEPFAKGLDAFEDRLRLLEQHVKEAAEIIPSLVQRAELQANALGRLQDRAGAAETAQDSLEQRLLVELDRRFKTLFNGEISEQIAKVFAGMKTQNERLSKQDDKIVELRSRASGQGAQLERLENWRARVSKQFGPEAQDGVVKAERARLEATAAAMREVNDSAKEVFAKLELGLLSLDADVVRTNKRIDEALEQGAARGAEIRERLAALEEDVGPGQLGGLAHKLGELEAFRARAVSRNPWLEPPPPRPEFVAMSAEEFARAKSIDGYPWGMEPAPLTLVGAFARAEALADDRPYDHVHDFRDVATIVGGLPGVRLTGPSSSVGYEIRIDEVDNVARTTPVLERTPRFVVQDLLRNFEKLRADYAPKPPQAFALSKAVMSAGGSNRFDLAIVRVPTVHEGATLRLVEVGGMVEIVEDAPNSGDTSLIPLDVAGARLLGTMLVFWADEREAKARGTEET